jgi:hypothetical protein
MTCKKNEIFQQKVADRSPAKTQKTVDTNPLSIRERAGVRVI